MSWHFSQALVEEYSRGISLDGAQSALLSGTPTPQAFLCSDRMTAFSSRSLYGMTFAPLTADLGGGLLTWFLAAFPARTSVLLDAGKGSMVNAPGSGLKWLASLARLDPVSFLWKTHQCSLFGGGYELLQNLPPWGSAHAGELWEHTQPAPVRTASACGLSLMRPTASEWIRHKFRVKSSIRKNHQDGNLSEQFARLFQTKNTPETSEILMQWPLQWTDLKPLGTDKIQSWQN